MQRNIRFFLFVGVLLFGALVLMFNGSHHVSAAAYDFIGDYQTGHSAGYNDCANSFPYANNSWQSQAYSDGYAEGYQNCQDLKQQGNTIGTQAGNDAGYHQCVTEHPVPSNSSAYPSYASVTMSPINQGIESTYGSGWKQGYNNCEKAYGSP